VSCVLCPVPYISTSTNPPRQYGCSALELRRLNCISGDGVTALHSIKMLRVPSPSVNPLGPEAAALVSMNCPAAEGAGEEQSSPAELLAQFREETGEGAAEARFVLCAVCGVLCACVSAPACAACAVCAAVCSNPPTGSTWKAAATAWGWLWPTGKTTRKHLLLPVPRVTDRWREGYYYYYKGKEGEPANCIFKG